MDRAKKVVLSFLNSGEGYFHTKTVIDESVKQPTNLYGPVSDRPERWDYTDKCEINEQDIMNVVNFAVTQIDKKLFKLIPSTAIHAALQSAIHTFDNSRFQSKMDSNIYNLMFKIILKKLKGSSDEASL